MPSGAIGSQLDISGCLPVIVALFLLWVAVMIFGPALRTLWQDIKRIFERR
jgi:hypothetical protein